MDKGMLLSAPLAHRDSIKKEFKEERMLPHSCAGCQARFSTGNELVQHIREAHPSFADNARPGRPMTLPEPKVSPPKNNDRYQNTIATCPFCQQDCQTRKKLMRHLDQEHKDDNEQDDGEPQIKFVRISADEKNKQILEHFKQQNNAGGPFVTPGPASTDMVQNLLKTISATDKPAAQSGKVEAKAATKYQYKCFWCDASYRKRGKLMDHIDNLHKHNKQAENKMSGSMEDTKPSMTSPSHVNQMIGVNSKPSMERLGLGGGSIHPQFMSGLQFNPIPAKPSVSAPSQPVAIPSKSGAPCSFTLAGSLTKKPKPQVKEPEKPAVCQFFMSKKDNPLANKPTLSNTLLRSSSNNRRASLPNLFDRNSVPYAFPYGMLPPHSIATTMQHGYLMSMRPPMLPHSPFYAPRMPLMMPSSSDFMMNPTAHMMDHHSPNSPQAQLIARMNAMAQTSPLARPKNPESPLDLTKSYIL